MLSKIKNKIFKNENRLKIKQISIGDQFVSIDNDSFLLTIKDIDYDSGLIKTTSKCGSTSIKSFKDITKFYAHKIV